jgi:hypothetical protein
LDYFKNILKSYNICLYDQFINLIENSTHEDYEVNALIRKLEKLDLNENRILKENSKIIIFLVTKTYQESNLFKLHLNEVNKLKKEVIIMLLEKHLHLDYTQLNDYKIYDLSDAVENSFDGYFLFEKSPDTQANECFEFIRKKLREYYFVKLF